MLNERISPKVEFEALTTVLPEFGDSKSVNSIVSKSVIFKSGVQC